MVLPSIFIQDVEIDRLEKRRGKGLIEATNAKLPVLSSGVTA